MSNELIAANAAVKAENSDKNTESREESSEESAASDNESASDGGDESCSDDLTELRRKTAVSSSSSSGKVSKFTVGKVNGVSDSTTGDGRNESQKDLHEKETVDSDEQRVALRKSQKEARRLKDKERKQKEKSRKAERALKVSAAANANITANTGTTAPASAAGCGVAVTGVVHVPGTNVVGFESRIVLVADVCGALSSLNDIARRTNAFAIVVTGTFGFHDEQSVRSMPERELRDFVSCSSEIPSSEKSKLLSMKEPELRRTVEQKNLLSELPLFLRGERRFKVPVYAVWGNTDDVHVVEKLRSRRYRVDNLFFIDEKHSVRIGDVRLLGLGGGIQLPRIFDNGEAAQGCFAGESGKMWVTLLQLGELFNTYRKSYDVNETRILVTPSSAGKEAMVLMAAMAMNCDFVACAQSVSGGGTFCAVYNEAAMNPISRMEERLGVFRSTVHELWEKASSLISSCCNKDEEALFKLAMRVIDTGRSDRNEYVNLWSIALPSLGGGYAVISQENGRVGVDTFSTGFRSLARKGAGMAPGAGAGGIRGGNKVAGTPGNNVVPGRAAASISCTAIVRGLPPKVRDEDVRRLFKGCRIKNVNIPKDKMGEIRGIAYVEFDDTEQLRKGLAKRGNLQIEGKNLIVEPSRSDGDFQQGNAKKIGISNNNVSGSGNASKRSGHSKGGNKNGGGSSGSRAGTTSAGVVPGKNAPSRT